MKLKPCPFCGAKEPIVEIKYSGIIDKEIVCNLGLGGCGARVGWYSNTGILIKAWNQRVVRKPTIIEGDKK